ncbi:MAG: hypothetical protein HEP71_08445 [Roseivirga sp.]|nr:hypothetical protein [Roseivirga sp.]
MSNSQRKKYLWYPLGKLITVISVFTMLGINWFNVNSDDLLLVVGGTWLWVGLIHLLPLIVLSVCHQKISTGASFTINALNKEYRYKKEGIDLSFNSSQIKEVIKIVSPPKYDDRMDLLGFGHFYYWKLILVDGTILSLSCMLLDSEEFAGHEIRKEKQMFPIPKEIKTGMTIEP